MGVGKDGQQKASYQPGYELLGKYTIFAEGCRGNLGETLMKHFDLRKDADPQHYGIGIKEIWEIVGYALTINGNSTNSKEPLF